MIVDRLEYVDEGEAVLLRARVRTDGLGKRDEHVWFRYPAAYCGDGEPDASPYLPPMILASMHWREALVFDAPVSARLLDSTEAALDVYQAFYPWLPRADISAPARALDGGGSGVGAFFTRGVDSWYTAWTNVTPPKADVRRLTHLIYVPSADRFYSKAYRDQATRATERAAADLSCELVVVETNVREFTERFLHWGFFHGPALAGIGHLLGSRLDRILLAATDPMSNLHPNGSHLLLDHHWSTERTEIRHDGAGASRLGKVRYLSGRQQTMSNLRVCHDADGQLNCGRCFKCVLTMLMLHAGGGDEGLNQFEAQLSPAVVRRLRLNHHSRQWLFEMVDELGPDGISPEYAAAVELAFLRDDLRLAGQRVHRLGRLWADRGLERFGGKRDPGRTAPRPDSSSTTTT